MNPTWMGLGLLVLAYMAGSIPFGYLTARSVRGIDIREHGSRNIGATNVGRVLGRTWGIFVFVLDLLKGFLPTSLVAWVMPDEAANSITHWQTGAGLATVLGHMFPCWLGLRGGKGVATALGVALSLAPLASAGAGAVFILTFLIWRYMSLSSMLAAVAFAILQAVFLRPTPWSAANLSLGLFSIVVPALIIIRHRANIGRLIRGEEPKFQAARPQS